MENGNVPKRMNVVNLASLATLFIMCVYILFYEVGFDLEESRNDSDSSTKFVQPRMQLLPCAFSVWLIVKPLALYTYFDDLLLTY